jgi:hypothetical protein
MTLTHERPVPPPLEAAPPAPLIDLSTVATEPPAESIAHENEIVEHIAHEHDFPDQPSAHPVEEQLLGLVDPTTIRQHRPPAH